MIAIRWTVIPPDRPYGSFDAMCDALLGMCSQDIRERIDRERRKSQQVADAVDENTGKTLPEGNPHLEERDALGRFVPSPTAPKESELAQLVELAPAERLTQAARAKKAGVSRRTIQRQDAVAKKHPELVEKIAKREISTGAADDIVKGKPKRVRVPLTVVQKALRCVARRLEVMTAEERAEFFSSLVEQYPIGLGGTADHVFGIFLLLKFWDVNLGLGIFGSR